MSLGLGRLRKILPDKVEIEEYEHLPTGDWIARLVTLQKNDEPRPRNNP